MSRSRCCPTEIAVVGVYACGALRPQNRVPVRRNVDVQIFEPEKVRPGGVGDRSHPIYPNPGDVDEALHNPFL